MSRQIQYRTISLQWEDGYSEMLLIDKKISDSDINSYISEAITKAEHSHFSEGEQFRKILKNNHISYENVNFDSFSFV